MANEKRLIDANALPVTKVHIVDEAGFGADFYVVYEEDIRKAKTVDAVEVVRCKDCKHLNVLNRKDLYAHCPKTNTVFFPFKLDTRTHFCSLGERREDGK